MSCSKSSPVKPKDSDKIHLQRYFSLSDLKALRLTSQKTKSLIEEHSNFLELLVDSEIKIDSEETLAKVIHTPRPYTKYFFNNTQFPEWSGFQTFMAEHGHEITWLKLLSECYESEEAEIVNIEFLAHCTNLTTLEFEGRWDIRCFLTSHSFFDEESGGSRWHEGLIHVFRNVKHLSINVYSPGCNRAKFINFLFSAFQNLQSYKYTIRPGHNDIKFGKWPTSHRSRSVRRREAGEHSKKRSVPPRRRVRPAAYPPVDINFNVLEPFDFQ